MQWIWIAALVLFIIVEAATSALVSLWFIGGSVAGLIASICGAPEWLQVILFFVVSAVLLFTLRPMTRKFLLPNKTVTNARSNIGKIAVVTETIDNLHGTGAAKVAGVLWSARSAKDERIEEGSVVRIVEIEGAKLCVEYAEEKKEVIL